MPIALFGIIHGILINTCLHFISRYMIYINMDTVMDTVTHKRCIIYIIYIYISLYVSVKYCFWCINIYLKLTREKKENVS